MPLFIRRAFNLTINTTLSVRNFRTESYVGSRLAFVQAPLNVFQESCIALKLS